ncbi:MAG TPA: hypothetical protein VHV78_17805 [Gemmatimonadaceae bacterium]|nr:hypothetical protein [Gemmatimonadaceae bacterium]
MNVVGRVSMSAAAGVLGLALVLGWRGARVPAASASAVQHIASADAYFDSTVVLARGAIPRGARGDELAVALGYLERLRLGVGSPFRLVDDALADPRLGGAMSPRVAWALLGRLGRGDAYVIDPAVLDGAGPWGGDGHGATGAAHVALIEHAVESASDPRAGELAVRLAYLIEAAKGTLAQPTPSIAIQVAALARDEALARRDLGKLLADAAAEGTSTLALLSERRADRAFLVEQPALAPLPASLQIEAMSAAPALVRALDTLDRVDPSLGNSEPRPNARSLAPVVGSRFAARLNALASARPPVPEIFVTLATRAKATLRGTNDESLVASYDLARAEAESAGDARESALAMLSAAVATRALAQDAPWFDGDGGPTVADLRSDFGLASVSFDDAVPAAWRPYYLRKLQTSLVDMRTVYPAVSFNDLHVRFHAGALRDSALALHDPRDRTLELPVATFGGTLAHELSHDIDWQASRRLYAGGTGYSTDRAMRDRRGALASSLRVMADARIRRSFAGSTESERPAELFARGSDWFVASVLAEHGRTNGDLSAIEDGLFAGYAAGSPAALGAAGTASLVSAIEEMTYLPDSVRAGFERQWSNPDVVDPALLVRRVLEVPVSWRTAALWSHGSDALGAPPSSVCAAGSSASARARERLLNLAIDARARGLASRRARYRPSSLDPGAARSILDLPPSSPAAGERLVNGLRAAIVAELGSSPADHGVVPVAPAIFRSNAESCSTIAR